MHSTGLDGTHLQFAGHHEKKNKCRKSEGRRVGRIVIVFLSMVPYFPDFWPVTVTSINLSVSHWAQSTQVSQSYQHKKERRRARGEKNCLLNQLREPKYLPLRARLAPFIGKSKIYLVTHLNTVVVLPWSPPYLSWSSSFWCDFFLVEYMGIVKSVVVVAAVAAVAVYRLCY